MNLQEIVAQLEMCGFECEAGPLANNAAFIALKDNAEKEAAAGTRASKDEKVRSNIPYCKSTLSVKEMLGNNITDEYAKFVAEILSFIGSKGATIETALYMLDQAKRAVTKCTILQDEYTL